MKLLFVCLGNICRSPTAEGIIKKICKEKNIKNLKCSSAGIANYHIGNCPDRRAIEVAKKNNVKIEYYKATQVDRNDFNNFDLIIGMDQSNIKILKKMGNEKKVKLYLNFTSEYKNLDVPDPYHGTLKDFEKSYKLIEIGAISIVKSFGY